MRTISSDEVAWRHFFQIWMKYINEFSKRGGLLTAGSDDGDVGGILYVRELELRQEAGLNPIDNLKVLYGRGYGFCGIVPRAEQASRGGVAWTIKEGVVFDAQALLREVEWYVQEVGRRSK